MTTHQRIPAGGWAAHQLADFLALVSACPDVRSALMRAVERSLEAFDADVGAILQDGEVACVLGMPDTDTTAAALRDALDGTMVFLPVPGVGPCLVAIADSEPDRAMRLLIARRTDDPFTPEERGLLRSMMRVLTLTISNHRLVASLRERQELLQRLSLIQRSISHRAELSDVFTSITTGLAELLGEEITAIRLIDSDHPDEHVLVCSDGLPDDVQATIRRLPLHVGSAGIAIRDSRLVVDTDYQASTTAVPELVDHGLRTMMAAPVHEGGVTVGAVLVASTDPRRIYTNDEQEALLAFAEHTSLALTDAQALAGMRRAFYDPLTRLPNRTLFRERLADTLAGEHGVNGGAAVLFIDLDRFKTINDNLGHGAGDLLLIEVAQRLLTCVRPEDTVARLGGDEFTILLAGVTNGREASEVAERMLAAIAQPFDIAGRQVVLSASIGIAFRDPINPIVEDLVNAADVAMYAAKHHGRGRAELFTLPLGRRARQRLDIETALRSAVDEGRLRLEYQPLVALQGRSTVTAVEALLRWDPPNGLAVDVPELIVIAEETGLINSIGRWAIEEACRQRNEWRAVMPSAPGVHVNVSGHQLRDPTLPGLVATALTRTSTPAEALTLEITESVLIGDDVVSMTALHELRELGVRLALDDFGKGHSSLAYLADLDIQSLKIDRSFVQRLASNAGAGIIVRQLIAMAQQLGMSVVAEGTETAGQVEHLRLLGCDLAQGFLFARPAPPAQVQAILTSGLGEIQAHAVSSPA